MLLIFPPLAKACEPPAGLPLLAGALRENDYPCTMLDANLEGQLHILKNSRPDADNWSRRAHRNLDENLKALRNPELYRHAARYRRSVHDLNRVLSGINLGSLSLTLANYQGNNLSPLKSSDLIQAAACPSNNIFHDYFAVRFGDLNDEHKPPMVGFSINYLSQVLTAFAMIGYLRENHPALPIIAGGGLITSWLSNPEWRNPFNGLIDLLIAGPGEIPLLKLLSSQTTVKVNPGNPSSNPELFSTENGRSVFKTEGLFPGRTTETDFTLKSSRYFCPDFKGLPLNDYIAPGPILPYAASSGCYWRKCSFCPENSEDNPYSSVPTYLVLQQLEKLTATIKPTLIHFLDNAISPALMRALIDKPPGPDWYSFARAEPDLADPDFCKALRLSGCVMLKLGLESGDQGVLDAMNKGIDLADVSKILTNLEEAGIATYVYLLFGTPPESLIEARRTLAFTVKHSSAITFLNLAIFNMPLSGPDAADLVKERFYEGDLSLYTDFKHPQDWNRRKIRRFLDREFKRHPDIAPIIRRDPPFFTSNHAPFFIHSEAREAE